MQRLFSVKFAMDGRYVLSGSDDTNIRLWKAQASAPIGSQDNRAVQSLRYRALAPRAFVPLETMHD